MDQAVIIRDLLNWLEGHLDQPLSLDNVATKAGYSKWHLQRMFKDVTGHAIGAYIRARRLTKSAVALRLTSRPILDIALQYRFDSQQTFTRAFKKQFSVTPALYRRASDWNVYGMRSPLSLDNEPIPVHQSVTLPTIHLVGLTQSYMCSLEEMAKTRHEMRIQFWETFMGRSPTIPPVLYGLNQTRPSPEKDDEQEVMYTTALSPELIDDHIQNCHPVTIEGGEYMQFTYEGLGTGLQEFIFFVYGTVMPALGLTRRRGVDIERYFPAEDAKRGQRPMQLRCDYFIPVRS